MVTYLPSFVFVTSFTMFLISIVIIRLAGIAISKMKPIEVLTKQPKYSMYGAVNIGEIRDKCSENRTPVQKNEHL